jgi:hypothetical protein
MRKYDVRDYLKKQRKYFDYLVKDYGFTLDQEKEFSLNYVAEYKKEGIRINLNYDTRDNFFYFTIIKGDNTQFPNDKDKENIRSFLMLFRRSEPNLGIDDSKIQPNDKQYEDSLRNNAELLKNTGIKC